VPFLLLALTLLPSPAQEPSFWDREGAIGDAGDVRPFLAGHGITVTLELTAEVFSNVSGGLERGSAADLLLDGVIDADLHQTLGWSGASFRINPMWLQGSGISEEVGDLTLVSNIAGRSGVRVFETWLQQSISDDLLSLRAGILAADQEFAISGAGLIYCNSVFGGPVFLSANVPWPIYPVGALGARLRANPTPEGYLQAAIYDGDPGSEESNRSGYQFGLGEEAGFFTIAETGWTWGECLPTTVKVGGFYHSGVDLGGAYALVEQRLLETAARRLDLFLRMGGSPGDAARVSFGLDAGLNATGWIPGRDADVFGLGVIYARLNDDYIDAQTDPSSWDHEIVLEATYRLQFAGWASLQPDVQYVIHPGGTRETPNALVLGLRLNVLF
jgi:porin